MRRHLAGIGLAITMVLMMFFAGAWGYIRLLKLPAPAGAPVTALPGGGGSLLANGAVLTAMGAMAGTAVLAAILVAVPRVSPLAPGLPGLFALAWQALYLLNVHRATRLIPLRAHAFGAGWEALLINGILGAAGMAMIIPLFLPSRWRGSRDEEDDEVNGYMAGLWGATPDDGPASGGMAPSPRTRPGPAPATGPAPTAANPVPPEMTQPRPRPGLVSGGQPHGAPPMRTRGYRHPNDL